MLCVALLTPPLVLKSSSTIEPLRVLTPSRGPGMTAGAAWDLPSPDLSAPPSLRATERRARLVSAQRAAASHGATRAALRRCSSLAMSMTPPEEVECDVVIVGGGPAGCTCALYTSRANLKTVVLDKNEATGALAITSTIANYPGVENTMSGYDLLCKMKDQAIEYGTDYRRAQVFLVEANGDQKVVYTPEATFRARALVLATGAMGRPPTFKGEGEYLGKGVSYCATCDGAFYCEREVAVVGVNKARRGVAVVGGVHWSAL